MTTVHAPDDLTARADGGRRRARPLPARASCSPCPTTSIYLDGNSLGRAARAPCPPSSTTSCDRQWGERLIRSWNEADWWGAQTRVGDRDRPAGRRRARAGASSPTRPRSTSSRPSSAPARLRPGRARRPHRPGLLPHRPLHRPSGAPALAGLEVRRVHPRDAVAAVAEVGDDVALASYSQRRLPHRRAVGPAARSPTPPTTSARSPAGTSATPPGVVDVRPRRRRRRPRGRAAATSTSTAARARRRSSTSRRAHQDDFDQPLTGWHGHARAVRR